MKILYYLLLAGWYLLSLLPLRVHYVISDVLFLLLYRLLGYRRRVVRTNLESAFPEKSEDELKRIEKGFYHFFCDYLAESVKLMTIGKENLRRRMVFKGAEQVVCRVLGAPLQLGVGDVAAVVGDAEGSVRTDIPSHREQRLRPSVPEVAPAAGGCVHTYEGHVERDCQVPS